MHEHLSQEDFTLFVVTLWAIRGARRKAMYEDIFQTPWSINGFIQSYIGELKAMWKPATASRTVTRSQPTHWIAPSVGLAKLNADAAVGRGGAYGTVGVICRNHQGLFLGASVVVFPNLSDPTTLEAMAIREALSLADDLYGRKIQVASDCKVAVDDKGRYGAIVHEIVQHKCTFHTCNIRHEFRSLNFEAHKLAKHALSLGAGRHVWLGQPNGLGFVLVNIVTE
ncbi:uncharacterized protein [Aegilops tauschii subsp. strangulata]|uniref:uncharacterized protein n=1 Tax=Aegilops tauschii subsp. strangulata TaxID=200361 RepID=UPI003CC874E2